MALSIDHLKQKYLQLRRGVDVPFSPENLPYAHSTGGAVITMPNKELIWRSIRAIQRRSQQVIEQVERAYADLHDDREFVDCMKEAPLLDNRQIEAIALKEEKLRAKEKCVQAVLKDELVHAAFAHLLSYAQVQLSLEPNILYHYYAHAPNKLVLSLIAPQEQPPFHNYVGAVRREDDDKLRVVHIAQTYKKMVLGSGEKTSSNF